MENAKTCWMKEREDPRKGWGVRRGPVACPALFCVRAPRGTSEPQAPHTPEPTAREYSVGHPDLGFAGEEQELGRTGMSQSIPSLA